MPSTDDIVRALAGGAAPTPTDMQLLQLSQSNQQQPSGLDPNQSAVAALMGNSPMLTPQVMMPGMGYAPSSAVDQMNQRYTAPQLDANGNPTEGY